jgi:hypothetical protein
LEEGRFEPPAQRASQIASCVPRGEFECVELSRGMTVGSGFGKKSPRSARPHCNQKCLPTGHIFTLGRLCRLAETSKKAAKYRIDSVACRYSWNDLGEQSHAERPTNQ